MLQLFIYFILFYLFFISLCYHYIVNKDFHNPVVDVEVDNVNNTATRISDAN